VELSYYTHKCALVPAHLFDFEQPGKALDGLVQVSESEQVKYAEIPAYQAVLVYALPQDAGDILPELYHILSDLPKCKEYNKILATFKAGYLFLGIAQRDRLLLANVYKAQDFTTALYYLFLALKSLQLNPEVSTICWRMPLGVEEEMTLYRYFKSVNQICE